MIDQPRDRRFFKAILDCIADGVFTVDEEKNVTSFNKAAERITGVPAAEALSRKCSDVFHHDFCESQCIFEQSERANSECVDVQVQYQKGRGEMIPLSVSARLVKDNLNQIMGAVVVFRDLSSIEHLRKELRQEYSFVDIVSKSPILHRFFDILPSIGESESTVLVQGPIGSGKELLARAIHSLSPRKGYSFVVIKCGALPPPLFESEIFGYKKGAFPEASQNRPGKLSFAERGTIYLDEIHELSLSTQVRVLHLIQNHEYETMGSPKPVKADVRVIAGTDRDLRELIALGKFRDDLYFRLAVVKMDLPSLKERREDVPILTEHFIAKNNAQKGKNVVSVSPEVMDILMRYDFPGNIRELENAIEYAYSLCSGRVIEIEHLPVELLAFQSSLRIRSSDGAYSEESLRIRETLRRNRGHLGRTCRDLGLHRTTLWRKMKKHNISNRDYK